MDLKLFMPIENNYRPEISIPNENIGYGVKIGQINWKREPKSDAVEIITDHYLKPRFLKSTFFNFPIGLILEPLEYLQISKRKIVKASTHLRHVLTYEDNLIEIDCNKFLPYYVGGSQIKGTEKLILNDKIEEISFVLSSKKITSGHKLRHKIVYNYAKEYNLKLFGNGISEFKERHVPFSPFKYSIVVENNNNKHLFTEKLVDCLLYKTIPIYYGGQKALEIFNPKGILYFSNQLELEKILNSIKFGSVNISEDIIKENQQIAFEYMFKELNIWNSLSKIKILNISEEITSDYINDKEKFLSGNASLSELLSL
jgi:hypothetical protein